MSQASSHQADEISKLKTSPLTLKSSVNGCNVARQMDDNVDRHIGPFTDNGALQWDEYISGPNPAATHKRRAHFSQTARSLKKKLLHGQYANECNSQ